MATDAHCADSRPVWTRHLGWSVVVPLVLAAWEVAGRSLGQPWILPPASSVAVQLSRPFADHYASGSLAGNALVSLVRVMIGFSLAALCGISFGLLMGSSRTIRGLFEPLVELLRPLCPIAWVPFAIAVFKLHSLPQLVGVQFTNTVLDQVQLGMVFVLFWGAFFPILINTIDGVFGVRRNYVLLAESLGASRRQVFLHVSLPAALPMVLTGLRQGIATCWFVIIAAEMLPGANSGIGYLLMYAADQSGMDVVIAAMVVIASLGALSSALLIRSTRRLVAWHGKEF